jgi:putative FmdB family regulatory protein
MPLYDFRCSQGHRFERFVSLRDFAVPQLCSCGVEAQRLLSAPMVLADLPGYVSPTTGRWIEGRVARREDLRVSGCRPYEQGEREAAEARRVAGDAALDRSVEETVEREFERMPVRKRERLAAELECGMDVEVTRRS